MTKTATAQRGPAADFAQKQAKLLGLGSAKNPVMTVEQVRIALGYKNVRQVYALIAPERYNRKIAFSLKAHNIYTNGGNRNVYVVLKKDFDKFVKKLRG